MHLELHFCASNWCDNLHLLITLPSFLTLVFQKVVQRRVRDVVGSSMTTLLQIPWCVCQCKNSENRSIFDKDQSDSRCIISYTIRSALTLLMVVSKGIQYVGLTWSNKRKMGQLNKLCESVCVCVVPVVQNRQYLQRGDVFSIAWNQFCQYRKYRHELL